MLIRSVGAGDLAQWEPLWAGYQRFYKAEIAPEVTRTTWDRLLDPTEPVWGAFAVNGERAVGLVHYLFHRSTWTIANYCYLQDLFVDESARGTGCGRALIEHVYAEAKLAGAARVYWLTHETNDTAMQLYDRVAEKSGFIQYRKLM